jgi:hypothetical protein
MNRIRIASFDDLSDRVPAHARASIHLMQTLARACGHTALQSFTIDDLTTGKKAISELTGVRFAVMASLGNPR